MYFIRVMRHDAGDVGSSLIRRTTVTELSVVFGLRRGRGGSLFEMYVGST